MPYGFIGDPAADENQFDPNLPASGITGWTGTLTPEQAARLPWNAGVQPAGGAYDIGGVAANYRNLGMDEPDIRATVYEPEQIRQSGMTLLDAAYDVPERTKRALADEGYAQVKRLQNLVNNGDMDIVAAGQATLAPWLNRVKQAAAEHRHPDQSLKIQKLTTWERNSNLYRDQLAAIENAQTPEEKALLEEQARLTKAWLDKQGKFAPAKSSESITEHIFPTESPFGGTNAPVYMTNITRNVTRPIMPGGTTLKTNSLPRILSIRPRQ